MNLMRFRNYVPYYFIFLLWMPLAICLVLAAVAGNELRGQEETPAKILIVLLSIPVLFNLTLGPLIYTYFRRISVRHYFVWFMWVPLGLCLLFAACFGSAFNKPEADNALVVVLICIPAVTAGFNFCFGPTIYAIWKRKRSRWWIMGINLLALFSGGIPALAMWLWAIMSKEQEPTPVNLSGSSINV